MSRTIFIRFKNTLFPNTKERTSTSESLKMCEYHLNETQYDFDDDVNFRSKLEELSNRKIINKKDINTIHMLKNTMMIDQFQSDIQYEESDLLKVLREKKKGDVIIVYCNIDKKVVVSYLKTTLLNEVVDEVYTLDKSEESKLGEQFFNNMINLFAKDGDYMFWDCNNNTAKRNSKIKFTMCEFTPKNVRELL